MTNNNDDCTILPIRCNEDDGHHYKVVQIICDFPSNSVDVNECCMENRAIGSHCSGSKDPDCATSIAVCGLSEIRDRAHSTPAASYHQSHLTSSQTADPESDRGPECFLYDHKSQTAKPDIHREPSPPRKQGFKKYDCHCYK